MSKVLIAVTSEEISAALSSKLPQHEIHICNSGVTALTMLKTLQPDILILDLMLPAMDGLTVLRKSSFRPRIILALTNLATPSIITAASAAGIQDVLLIPCTTNYMVYCLDALIEKASSPEG